MPTYVFTYRSPTDSAPADGNQVEAWQKWFKSMGASVESIGNPVFERTTVGQTGAGTELGGFSFINADDLKAAAELARGCPVLGSGGGVEIGVLADVPS
ncbi:MAG TPA: hypothetical protein VGU73_11205 [Acidimicrobiia bacterium]|nr:hypothetical protein [Acidimicrobiia bacterium]